MPVLAIVLGDAGLDIPEPEWATPDPTFR